jgi:hypothetical protein
MLRAVKPSPWKAKKKKVAPILKVRKGEAVNHPSHYNQGKFEVIDVIHDWKLGFDLGNAVKYIARAGAKDQSKYVEDLKKAIFYINDEIKRYEIL